MGKYLRGLVILSSSLEGHESSAVNKLKCIKSLKYIYSKGVFKQLYRFYSFLHLLILIKKLIMDLHEPSTTIRAQFKVEDIKSESDLEINYDKYINDLTKTLFNKINYINSDTNNVINSQPTLSDTEFQNIISTNPETLLKSSKPNETTTSILQSLLEYAKKHEGTCDELQTTNLDSVQYKYSVNQHNNKYLIRENTLHSEEHIDIKNEIEEQSKIIDDKLLQYAIVYTKKLDDMNAFISNNYTFVKGKHKIDSILIESKPIKKVITKEENSLVTPELEDISVNVCPTAFSPEPNPEPVKCSNCLLNKPRNLSFNSVKLKNNPDFNKKLKGISNRFLLSSRNKRLLKRCIPVTVDLYRGLDKILVNNSLYLTESDSQLSENKKSTSLSNSIADKDCSNSCTIDTRKVDLEELKNENNPVIIVNVEQCSDSSNITTKAHITVKEPTDQVGVKKESPIIKPRNTYIYFRKKAPLEGGDNTVTSETQIIYNYDDSIKKILLLTNQEMKSNLPKSPIYFGDNNILLCLFKNENCNSSVSHIQNIWQSIPNGVQIILLQDRQLSISIDASFDLKVSHLSTLPDIITCIQKELISLNVNNSPVRTPANMLTSDNYNVKENESSVVNRDKPIPLLEDPTVQLALKKFPGLYVVISSHLEMAYASKNDALFYKLNTDSGVIKPVSICLKRQPCLNNTMAECNNNITLTQNEERNPIQFFESVNSFLEKDGKSIILHPIKSGHVIPPGFNGKKLIKIVRCMPHSNNSVSADI